MKIVEILKNEITVVAKDENVSVAWLTKQVQQGMVVITKNSSRPKTPKLKVCGIGQGLKTKVNANIGTSPDYISIQRELDKLESAINAGTDTVMDLSTGGNLRKIRHAVIQNSTVPLGTVPIYQAGCDTIKRGKKIEQMDANHMFDVIEEQAADGIDFVTVHCGVTKKNVELLRRSKRLVGIVSRGGAFLAKWIIVNGKENPLYAEYDRLLEIAKKYNLTLSLGDGLRPGCLADASDNPQLAELSVLGELVLRARKAGVQAMVEGPGHMPIDQIQGHVRQAKKMMHNAPYYLLGPLVTDVAPGYDHITGAIGGALAAWAGADFLCYVTPAEHLRLPNIEDVHNGVIASRIAGHAADIAKGKNARQWDDKFSKYRKALDWKHQKQLAMDPDKFDKEYKHSKSSKTDVCTMCGQYCAMREADDVGM